MPRFSKTKVYVFEHRDELEEWKEWVTHLRGIKGWLYHFGPDDSPPYVAHVGLKHYPECPDAD